MFTFRKLNCEFDALVMYCHVLKSQLTTESAVLSITLRQSLHIYKTADSVNNCSAQNITVRQRHINYIKQTTFCFNFFFFLCWVFSVGQGSRPKNLTPPPGLNGHISKCVNKNQKNSKHCSCPNQNLNFLSRQGSPLPQ